MGIASPTDFPSNSKVNSYETIYWFFDGWRFLSNQFNVSVQTANYSARLDDYIIYMDCSGGARSIVLPDATTCVGKIYIIVKTDTSGNDITITATNSDIDEAASYTLTNNTRSNAGGSASFVSCGILGWMERGAVTGNWINPATAIIED